MHRPDHAKIVCVFTQPGEDLTDLQSTFPIPIELERGSEGISRLALGLQISSRERLAMVLRQEGLWIKRVNLGWASVQI